MKINKISTISKIFLLIAFSTIVFHFLLHPVRILNMGTSIFYMDEEFTIASIITVSFAFYCGVLALEYFLKSKRISDLIWVAIFWGLAFDEYFSVHEYLNDLFKRNVVNSDLLTELASLSWVFTLGIIFLIVALFILREVFYEKDIRIKTFLFLGIVSYLIVIVVEVIGGQTYGNNIYLLFVGLEEGLEMIGTVFFIEAFRNKLLSVK